MTTELAVAVLGVIALVLEHMRTRKLDEGVASTVRDLEIRVAVIEQRVEADKK